jgi:hypothetical protein
MESVVVSELGAVIERDGATQRGWQSAKELGELARYWLSRLAVLTPDEEQA